MKMDSYTKDIAAATVPENLIADAGVGVAQPKYARSIIIRCPSANTSDLLVGSKDRQYLTIPKGTTFIMEEINRAGQSGKYELAEIFIKAGTNGDDVEIGLIDPSDE